MQFEGKKTVNNLAVGSIFLNVSLTLYDMIARDPGLISETYNVTQGHIAGSKSGYIFRGGGILTQNQNVKIKIFLKLLKLKEIKCICFFHFWSVAEIQPFFSFSVKQVNKVSSSNKRMTSSQHLRQKDHLFCKALQKALCKRWGNDYTLAFNPLDWRWQILGQMHGLIASLLTRKFL